MFDSKTFVTVLAAILVANFVQSKW